MEQKESNKRIIEIAGVKLEVDLTTAVVVSNYKVGDSVKLLIKQYEDTFNTYPGVIVGFDNFVSLPTITVAYIDTGYGEGIIKFKHINSNSKDTEMCPLQEYEFPHERTTVVDKFDREIVKKEEELRDLKTKRKFFLAHFGMYFDTDTATIKE